MAKKDFTAALDASLESEAEAVNDRFNRADTYYGDKEKKAAGKETAPAPQKKAKAVRDIFSMPSDDHALIDKLRKTCTRSDIDANKSLIIRAGLHALDAMSHEQLLELVGSLERLKPGRKS